MKESIKVNTVLILAVFGIALTIVLSGCDTSNTLTESQAEKNNIIKIQFEEDGVTCYRNIYRDQFSCVKTN